MQMQSIEITIHPNESVQDVACITVTGHDGRKARAWVRAVIRPNGRCRFILSMLGRSEASDGETGLTAAWHDDLR